ncbi:hypothetical protein H4R27_001973 [Coemansia aciculifera]|nr:hypothetical protein H4R27_001973 [Coemansia aciculifera]
MAGGGLGLTLNPADAVVRLQPRHATLTQPRSLGSIKQRNAVQLNSPVIVITEPEEPNESDEPKEPDLSPGLSLFASPQPSLTPSESFHSPRTGDPQPVTLPQRAVPGKAQGTMSIAGLLGSPAGSVAEVPSVEDLRSFVSCTSSLSPAQPRLPQTPVTGAVAAVTCLLCFERVLVAPGRTRGHAMRCPSCFGSLSGR